MKKVILVLIIFFDILNVFSADSKWNILKKDDFIFIQAGKLQKKLNIRNSQLIINSFILDGKELSLHPNEEVSFRLLQANLGWKPILFSDLDCKQAIETTATFGQTDQLKVKQTERLSESESAWKEIAVFKSVDWHRTFNQLNYVISEPKQGVKHLTIRLRSTNGKLPEDFWVSVNYEIYEGFPAIRQWVEFVNNTSNIYKVDKLFLSKMNFQNILPQDFPLTPDDKVATASIRAFSSADESYGLILGSELPSATRFFDKKTGVMGYEDNYFEWILMPSEKFESEPISYYAFSGEVFSTISSISKPLDRCIEGEFQSYLDQCIGVVANKCELYVPRYSTWSNYASSITGDICEQIIPIAAKCGFKLFEIDDGWQRDRLGTEPHAQKFYQIDKIAGLIQEYGMDLGLWVSCYRDLNSKDVKALPNAISLPLIKRLGGYGMSFASNWRNFFAQDIVFLRDKYGAKLIKEDFSNILFGDQAFGHDSRSLKESYLKGLRGLLEAQKIVKAQSPDITMMLSHEIYWGTPGVPCDLAVMKSAACYHIPPNDYSGLAQKGGPRLVSEYSHLVKKENVIKEHYQGCYNARRRYYEHRGLPMHMIEYYGAASANVQGGLTTEIQDRQICSFLMGIPTVYSGDLLSLTQENIMHYRKRFDILDEYQKKYGIYRFFQFSGVPEPTDEDWHWWGKLNSEKKGIIVVIRGNAGENKRKINIPWVNKNDKYIVKSLFTGEFIGEFIGGDLQDGKLEIQLPKMGQTILAVE